MYKNLEGVVKNFARRNPSLSTSGTSSNLVLTHSNGAEIVHIQKVGDGASIDIPLLGNLGVSLSSTLTAARSGTAFRLAVLDEGVMRELTDLLTRAIARQK